MKKKGQGNLLTSASSPCASLSGRAGWPPTSIQLCRISTSSSSLVIGLLSSSFPSLESSERESDEKIKKRREAEQPDVNTSANLLSKLVKKKEVISYLCHSGSSSFSSLMFPIISSNLAHFAVIRTSYLV